MRIGIRVLCVLCFFYNVGIGVGPILSGLAEGLGVGGSWLLSYPNTRMVLMLLTAAALAFLLAHCIRLIMFYDFARRVQFWLCVAAAALRVPQAGLLMLSGPGYFERLIILLAVALSFDIGIALAMRSNAARSIFKEAQDRRDLKYWAKKNECSIP